ncbi:2-oxo-4-hydroxy-4-carboxy-5-ureidoimidazoline decarboxylase [soil metagenome]
MQGFQIYKNLAWLNSLSEEEAQAAFSNCCGSAEWSRRMTAARPFAMLDELFRTAARLWYSLTTSDRLAAFTELNENEGPHSKAGKRAEHTGGFELPLSESTTEVGDAWKELAEAVGLYEDKFGFIFVLSSKVRTTAEILAVCRARLGNSVETEIRIASDEQFKIIETKLSGLLEQ